MYKQDQYYTTDKAQEGNFQDDGSSIQTLESTAVEQVPLVQPQFVFHGFDERAKEASTSLLKVRGTYDPLSKRETYAVMLRKQKKQDVLTKRRVKMCRQPEQQEEVLQCASLSFEEAMERLSREVQNGFSTFQQSSGYVLDLLRVINFDEPLKAENFINSQSHQGASYATDLLVHTLKFHGQCDPVHIKIKNRCLCSLINLTVFSPTLSLHLKDSHNILPYLLECFLEPAVAAKQSKQLMPPDHMKIQENCIWLLCHILDDEANQRFRSIAEFQILPKVAQSLGELPHSENSIFVLIVSMLFQIATQGMTSLDDLKTEIGDLQKCVIRIFQQGPFDVEILSRLLSFLLNIVDVATLDQALKIISEIPHVTEFLIKFILGSESAAQSKFEDDKLRNCALQVIHKLLLKHKMSQPRLYTETLLGQLSAYGFIPALSSAWQGGQVASNLFTIQILEILSNLAKAQVSSSCGLSFVYEIMSDRNLSSMLNTCGSSHNSIIVEHVLKIHSHNIQSYLLAGCLPDEYLAAFQICSLVVNILDNWDQHSFQAQAFALYIIADIIEFSDHSSFGIEELLQMNVFQLLTTYHSKCKNEKNFDEAQKILDWFEECCPETVAYVSPRRLIPSETSTPIISSLYFNI